MQTQKTSKLAITTFILSIILALIGLFSLVALLQQDPYVSIFAGGFVIFIIMPLGLVTLVVSLFALASVNKHNLKGTTMLKISWIVLLLLLVLFTYVTNINPLR